MAHMQFLIREEDQYKTSFRVPGGQNEFRVGAFGLQGTSSVRRRALSFDSTGRARPADSPPGSGAHMLGRFVQVYCDDILIFSKTREEHLMHVRMVLETLRQHKLHAKASKCLFGRSSVVILSHVFSEGGVAVDPRKVAAVAGWATPKSCTDVRRFVGLAKYYREFVLRFSAIAGSLTALCSPRAMFTWGSAVQQGFDVPNAARTSALVLRVWDPARPTRLLTNAAELAVSVILEPPDDAGAFHPSPSSPTSLPSQSPRTATTFC